MNPEGSARATIRGKRSKTMESRKQIQEIIMKKLSFTVLVLAMLCVTGVAHATTYYMCNSASTCNSGVGSPSGWSTGSDSNAGTSKSSPFLTLYKAYTTMSGGDTLVIGNGTYYATAAHTNVINISSGTDSSPPVGSSSAYTTTEAENTGGVIFSGSGAYEGSLFDVEYGGSDNTTHNQYWQFVGLVWCSNSGSNVTLQDSGYVKFINCGAYDAGAGNEVNFNIQGVTSSPGSGGESAYVLVEGCYAWGTGRYKFCAHQCAYIIFRNCVGRMDGNNPGGQPTAVFSIYSNLHSYVQNCIAIDADQSSYWTNVGEWTGCFQIADTLAPTSYATFENNVCLNSQLGALFIANNTASTNVVYKNMVFWAVNTNQEASTTNNPAGPLPTAWSRATSPGSFYNLTFGNSNSSSVAYPFFYSDNGDSLYNSIFTGITVASGQSLLFGTSHSYNDYYANSVSQSPNAGDVTTNPGLKWLPLSCTQNLPSAWSGISGSTSMCGTGQGGANIGANLIYLTGTPGTLYGDTGYDTQTTTLMWPYPNEALIKSQMQPYSNGGVSGNRGFATSANDAWGQPVTLTTYVWQYLGNQIPSSIYAASGLPALQAPTGLRVVTGQ
jgi:hypothetical protein